MSGTKGIKKVFITKLSDVSEKNEEGLGTLRFEGNCVYKYVKYDDGAANLDCVKGDIVFYKDYENNVVTPDISDAAANIGAGVIQATVTEDARYLWIQVRGLASLNTDVVAGAVGNALTAVGTNDKTLDVNAAVTSTTVATLEDATASAQKIICDFPF